MTPRRNLAVVHTLPDNGPVYLDRAPGQFAPVWWSFLAGLVVGVAIGATVVALAVSP